MKKKLEILSSAFNILGEIRFFQLLNVFLRGLFIWEMPIRVCGSVRSPLTNNKEIEYDFYVLPDKFWINFNTNTLRSIYGSSWRGLTRIQKTDHYKAEIFTLIENSVIGLEKFAMGTDGISEDWISGNELILYQAFVHRMKIGNFKFFITNNKFKIHTLKEIRERRLDAILS